MMPNDAGVADKPPVLWKECEIVAHNVAMIDSERRTGTNDTGQRLVPDEAKFPLIAGLHVCKQKCFELAWLQLAPQRKVD
ncbi:MAG: hypothetical protein ABL901_04725 [Hyphomicrobiaceae bacterium]